MINRSIVSWHSYLLRAACLEIVGGEKPACGHVSMLVIEQRFVRLDALTVSR